MEFLIPASIAEELKHKLRTHLRIAVLDTANLEALFSNNIAAIARFAPTAAEREAFLETELTDPLLRRLPIHARMDETVGDAAGVFHVTDEWPVPVSLVGRVPIVQMCLSPKAQERQKRLILAWSPQSQIEVGLSQPQPHLLWREILHALAKIPDKAELAPQLAALQKTPWLVVEGKPFPPEDVLALPPDVDEAARTVLLKDGDTPPFMPATKLAIDIREDTGFAHLKEWVLPDQRRSFATLALMIEDSQIVGRLGSADSYPVDDFTTLASDRGDLKLPGWPLLAAALISQGQPR
jgi:hypothetical protein